MPTGPPIAVAEPDSQRYVVHCGTWQEFAAKVWQTGQRLGLETALELVVLGDGAVWITSLVEEILAALPGRVIQILDRRHAEPQLWAVAHACVPDRTLAWMQTPLEHLHEGRVTELVAALWALTPPTAEAADLVATTITYYAERRALLDYPRFRALGLQLGSGLAESAGKRLVGQRAKGPGMHWSVTGAQAILTLRAARLSGQWPEVLACARTRTQAALGDPPRRFTRTLDDIEVREALRWLNQLRRPIRLSARPHVGLNAPRVIAQIDIDGLPVGYVSALETGRTMEQPGLLALEQSLSIFALELRRRQDIAKAERAFASELLHDLLDANRLDTSGERARRLGYDLDEPYTVAVLNLETAAQPAALVQEPNELQGKGLVAAVSQALVSSCPGHLTPLIAARDDTVVVLQPATFGADHWRQLHRELGRLRPELTVTLAIGEPAQGVAAVVVAHAIDSQKTF
ncbi:MAG: hypothetical protein HY329_26205 [Chloroflexi bacterium]|nr:hypothetical protein [Chloroflexota bacterium]